MPLIDLFAQAYAICTIGIDHSHDGVRNDMSMVTLACGMYTVDFYH
tara:strand:- start:1243 stop:1380 length:138 start_codon:yes stop_codon:yes gene_type:complete